MPKYVDTATTAKIGVNYVRSIVDQAKCIYHPIRVENDLGIDGIIELIKDGVPLNKQIAVQIKSGKSYFSSKTDECIMPVDGHFEYWQNHPLPVYGIVYVPSENAAYWINIKHYLELNNQCRSIKFKRSQLNIFNQADFDKYFVPSIRGEMPELSFDEATDFFQSDDLTINYLGLVSLFKNHANNLEVWDWFFEYLRSNNSSIIHPILMYYIAHIPWHGDMLPISSINDETKAYVRNIIFAMKKNDIVKLLEFIDEENGIARGKSGQSVEAIISSIPNRDSLLKEIIEDSTLPMFNRECAALIYSYHNQNNAIKTFTYLYNEGSSNSSYWLGYLAEGNGIDLYG